ncbi:Putative ribonuclease H protein [Dendrobium catenatum]|uniref:Ribonuclease H protein n=1 Tax=Dendrobium catenatum TaxID=906689 RepID=A0A2I0X0F7_9ASPA|nr:Putative ribonuclease H protein [Dendrobium catenatum]
MEIQKWGIYVPVFESLKGCLFELKRLSITAPNVIRLYCNSVYINWKNRNEGAHGKNAKSISSSAAELVSTAFSISNPLIASWGANLPRKFQNIWHPPPPGWIKINVDAALLTSYNASIGGCFRDDKGRLLIAFGEKRTHWDIATLELDAVMTIRKFIQPWMLECKGLILEGDNLNVIKFIQNSLNKAKWQSYNRVQKNLLFLADFNKVLFIHAHRNCNRVADMCATLALENNFYFDSSSFASIPPSLTSILKKECEPLL